MDCGGRTSFLVAPLLPPCWSRPAHRCPRYNVGPNRARLLLSASYDGGATFAEVWTLYERQPDMYDAACSDGLVASAKTGSTYFGHPHGINGTRTNYTILRSMDQGATFSMFRAPIYPSGAGYSSLILLANSGPGDLIGVAFQRTIWDSQLEGGGYNIGFATVAVP